VTGAIRILSGGRNSRGAHASYGLYSSMPSFAVALVAGRFEDMDSRIRCHTRILILNFNGAKDTINCIKSLKGDPLLLDEQVLVIDNASTDGSVDQIQSEFPRIRVQVNRTNLGYAGGMNSAISKVLSEGVESILILNNDTIVHPGVVGLLNRTLQQFQDFGIVGPAVLDAGSDKVQSQGIDIDWIRGRSPGRYSGRRYDDVPHCVQDVDFVSGCAMLVKREVFERVGLFPSNFFLYGEETDLCLRAKRSGFRVVCDSRAVVEHGVGSTVNRYPGLQAFYSTRNRFLVTKRHGSIGQFVAFSLWTMLFELPRFSLGVVVKRLPLSVMYSKAVGVFEGLRCSLSESRIVCER